MLAPPLWERIERMPARERELYRSLRIVYGSAMINGPSSLILAHPRGMVGLNDRIKLRPLVAAEAGARVLIVNAQPTPFDRMADLVDRRPIQVALPDLVSELLTAS